MAKKENKKINKLSGGIIAMIIYLFILAFLFIFYTIGIGVLLVIEKVTFLRTLSFLVNLIVIFFSISSIILVFKKSKKFRTWASIAFLTVIAGFIIINGISAIISWGVILSIICILYLSLSKRVKNTFVK